MTDVQERRHQVVGFEPRRGCFCVATAAQRGRVGEGAGANPAARAKASARRVDDGGAEGAATAAALAGDREEGETTAPPVFFSIGPETFRSGTIAEDDGVGRTADDGPSRAATAEEAATAAVEAATAAFVESTSFRNRVQRERS